MSFLRVDYDRAIAQAKNLDAAADMCRKALNDLNRDRNASEAVWVGESGDAMRMQMQAAVKELDSTRSQLTAIAASIRRVAEELKKKDEEMRRKINSFG